MYRPIRLLFQSLRSALRVFVLLLIGTIMTVFVGLPLIIGGRPEGLIPFGVGALALYNLRREFAELRLQFSSWL